MSALDKGRDGCVLEKLAQVAGGKFSNFDDIPDPSLSDYEIVVSGRPRYGKCRKYESGPPGKTKPNQTLTESLKGHEFRSGAAGGVVRHGAYSTPQ